jgi:zinc/manganese transport system substrate-binding protein
MRTSLIFACILALFAGPAAARPLVVTTLPDLAAVARAVGGPDVDVRALVAPTEDPHYVDPRPSFVVTLADADILLFNGLELEVGWLPPLLVNARNPKVQAGGLGHVDASRLVAELVAAAPGKVDRAMGDIHPGGNPHFTWSPRALGLVARGLAGRLALTDPQRAVSYVERATSLARDLEALETRTRTRFEALPNRKVVVYHDSLPYLLRWLGLEQVATIEEKPGVKPGPGQVADVLKVMRAQGVKVILQESWHPDKPFRPVAELVGAKLLLLQGGARADQDVVSHLEAVANEIYDALSR